ncbi:MAG: hypothetical protein EOM77_05695 [Bacteroidia bacterium]|nr:hypothetical protein [Bacteroidia bacterium]
MTYTSFGLFIQEAYEFIISPEFQAVVTAVIGIVGVVVVINNKIKALRLVSTENRLAKKNVEVTELQKDIKVLIESVNYVNEENKALKSMFAAAFMNSRKLDEATKQQIARLSVEKATSEAVKVIQEQVIEQAETIVKTPVKAEEAKPSAFEVLTK